MKNALLATIDFVLLSMSIVFLVLLAVIIVPVLAVGRFFGLISEGE